MDIFFILADRELRPAYHHVKFEHKYVCIGCSQAFTKVSAADNSKKKVTHMLNTKGNCFLDTVFGHISHCQTKKRWHCFCAVC